MKTTFPGSLYVGRLKIKQSLPTIITNKPKSHIYLIAYDDNYMIKKFHPKLGSKRISA